MTIDFIIIVHVPQNELSTASSSSVLFCTADLI